MRRGATSTAASRPYPADPALGADPTAAARHDIGNRIVGEAVFIPRPVGGAEDQGHVAVHAKGPVTRGSDLVLPVAPRIDAAPVAVPRLPQRVPQGLHGNRIAD